MVEENGFNDDGTDVNNTVCKWSCGLSKLLSQLSSTEWN